MVIACGALGGHLREIIARRGWRVELHCLPALLHNRPSQIIPDAERIALCALARGQRVALAYADCGTYGALDGLCARLGLRRLPGLHCYDVLAGSFGSYLSPASAIRIGLVPKVPVMRVVSAGNVAGEGAKMALLSLRERAGGLALLEEVRYVELSDRADFNDRFVEQLPFPDR